MPPLPGAGPCLLSALPCWTVRKWTLCPARTPAAQGRDRAGLAIFPRFARASGFRQAQAPSLPAPRTCGSGGPKADSPQLLSLPLPQLSQSLVVLESKGSGCPVTS